MKATAMNDQPVSFLLCALGGEGGGVLADWLVHTARQCGHAVSGTSIPGVAQRTGATTYYLEVFPVPLSELAGKRPVFGLNPLPGRLDVLVSSELLETARQIANGLPSNDRTLVITSSARALTTLEKMEMGDGRRDDAQLLALVLRSIRVENRQRLMQMENALHHLEQGSDELARRRNRLRQEEIVEEIEVITGMRGGMR